MRSHVAWGTSLVGPASIWLLQHCQGWTGAFVCLWGRRICSSKEARTSPGSILFHVTIATKKKVQSDIGGQALSYPQTKIRWAIIFPALEAVHYVFENLRPRAFIDSTIFLPWLGVQTSMGAGTPGCRAFHEFLFFFFFASRPLACVAMSTSPFRGTEEM